MAKRRSDEEYPYNLLFDIDIEDVCNSEVNIEENLNEVLLTLTEREQKVLSELYKNNITLEECGKIFSVTRERIRQIQCKALRKLKHPSRIKYIKYGKLSDDYSNMKAKLYKLEKRVEEINQYIMWACETFGVIGESIDRNSDLPHYGCDRDIIEMELSVRSYNCLIRGGIKKIGDLEGLTDEDLLKIRNLGRRSMMEVIDKAAEYGIEIKRTEQSLGTNRRSI